MAYQNALEALNQEYRAYLLKPKPLSQEDGERAEGIRRALATFNQRASEILRPFDTRHWEALLAILRTQPGNLDYMFNSWLEQLRGLGILSD